VDHRVKTFEDEATRAFAFLVELGCERHASAAGEPPHRPFAQTVAFHGPDVRVETTLVLEFGGDDSVATTLATTNGIHRFPELVARKGHEMRRALATHAEEVRRLLATAG
jgi:hypothetical protein